MWPHVATGSPRKAPGGPRRPQGLEPEGAPGGPRKPQKATGRPQEGPRRPQEAPGGSCGSNPQCFTHYSYRLPFSSPQRS